MIKETPEERAQRKMIWMEKAMAHDAIFESEEERLKVYNEASQMFEDAN